MAVSQINIPRKLDLENTLLFVKNLFEAPETDEYLLNFSSLKWVEPFSLLYLSCAIAQFSFLIKERSDNSKIGVADFNNRACSYASHMGFFKSFRVDHGNKPGEANSNLNYIPITIIGIAGLRQKAKENREHVGEVIEKKLKSLL